MCVCEDVIDRKENASLGNQIEMRVNLNKLSVFVCFIAFLFSLI